jgi:hypothetical protein
MEGECICRETGEIGTNFNKKHERRWGKSITGSISEISCHNAT